MQALELLLKRNSHPRLLSPAPEGEAMAQMYQAALRAPDHASLTPWRFIEFRGSALLSLGEIFVQAQLAQDPATPEADLDKIQRMPQRAPLVIAVVAACQVHPKVPEIEQQLSAGCAAHGLLLAAEALGFAGLWRSGWLCFDPLVKERLGLTEQESLVGFLYLGTPQGRRKILPERHVADFVQQWPQQEG